MWQEIGRLFTTNQITPVIFVLVGVALCIVEIFLTKATNIGLIGGAVIVAAMMAVMMLSGTFTQFLFLTFVVMILIVVAFSVAYLVKENGILFRKEALQTETVNLEPVDPETALKKLVGREGVAHTDLNPRGKIIVNSITLDAVANKGEISKNASVKITRVDGIDIYVKEIEEENE